MNNDETERYEAFRRVRDFGVANASDFPAASLGHDLFTQLGGVVTETESLASAQDSHISSSRQVTDSKSLARDVLEDEMEAISHTAPGLAMDNPGLENKFRRPRSMSETDLLTLARSFLADATPLADKFIRHGMPADFLDDLREAIAAFERAITERDNKREDHVSATAAIGPVIARGMKVLKQLNIVVRNVYRNNAAMLAAWTSASHITRRSRKTVPPAPPQPAPEKPPSA